MSEKKHIDRLFQEKLKDFEATPSDAVWQNISSQMEHIESDAKGIPRWWKLAGIAAGIVVLVTIGNMMFNTNESQNEPAIVEDDNKTNELLQTPNNQDASLDEVIDLDAVNAEDVVSKDDPSDKQNKADDTSSDGVNSTIPNTVNNTQFIEESNAVVSQNSEKSQTGEALSGSNPDKTKLKDKSTLKANTKDAVEESVNSNTAYNKDGTTKLDNEKGTEMVKGNADSSKEALTLVRPEVSTSSDITVQISKSLEEVNALTMEGVNKPSLTEEIEKMRAEKLAKEDVEEDIQRWSVSPNIAPVYFNSLGSGSSIDEQFNTNDKTGDINMSYGVVANYNFNKKLSIRAGVNQVKLGYSTNNVVVYNNIGPVDPAPLRNVRLNDYGQTLSFLSVDGLGFAQLPGVVAQNITSSIDQKLGFIEVPVELEYKLSDSKFGVSLIGGFSTLFLNENEVSTSLQGNSRVLGEATNIKETSFSANLGLGLNYNISKQFNLNLEPVFKYQLNTFSNTSGDFNPYFIGVYTGFSFKF